MPQQEKKLTRAQAEAHIEFLEDRMALMLVILDSRTGNDWNPWRGEAVWDGEMGEELRGWTQYRTAQDIIRSWIAKHDKRMENELGKD